MYVFVHHKRVMKGALINKKKIGFSEFSRNSCVEKESEVKFDFHEIELMASMYRHWQAQLQVK
jgi:hypothetical protein